ncbi:MAG: XkdX family protein [Lachnospiraceae bacterium]|nr:XkdX family protein [Lachnospiraceae bacterium]
MSEKFEKVKGYYDSGLWSAERVKNAVGRWITEEDFEEIVGEESTE